MVASVNLAHQCLVDVARPAADADELGVSDFVGLYAARLHHGQNLFRLIPVVASPEKTGDEEKQRKSSVKNNLDRQENPVPLPTDVSTWTFLKSKGE